jgi:hypothetical protein
VAQLKNRTPWQKLYAKKKGQARPIISIILKNDSAIADLLLMWYEETEILTSAFCLE